MGKRRGQEVVMAESPPLDALPTGQGDNDELEYIEVHWANVDLYIQSLSLRVISRNQRKQNSV